ncbi:hypothetical protein Leryth_010692, partial [Lithospermum erythrorhizon]
MSYYFKIYTISLLAGYQIIRAAVLLSSSFETQMTILQQDNIVLYI